MNQNVIHYGIWYIRKFTAELSLLEPFISTKASKVSSYQQTEKAWPTRLPQDLA